MSATLAIPEQIATCGCTPETDYLPCRGEFYRCNGCGLASDDPMPYAEPMNAADLIGRDAGRTLDMTDASSWFWYCKSCGEEWIKDGATVLEVKR